MASRRNAVIVAAAWVVFAGAGPAGQQRADSRAPLRLYVFDNGAIRGLDTKLFGFARQEVKEADFITVSYLIVHPKGTLQFDAGAIPDSRFKGDGIPVVEGVTSATRPLAPQMAAAGHTASGVTFFAASHYHSDHMANANDFAGSTWIVQRAERDWMFAEKPQGIIRPADYAKLRDARTRLLDDEDLDVFGDGTVVVKSAPGHTPGHQVLFVRLPKRGPVLLAGDLYHYPEERTTGRLPTFEFNAELSRASRQRIEAFVSQTGAELWIEHDIATHARLPRAPGFVE
jgi:glyoxylase-like metal-dependent hydrolase (beta-lactamase superfamily II)